MIELALAILGVTFLAWLGFWIIFYGFVGVVQVVAGPFVAIKRWLDRKAFDAEMSEKDRDWAEAMPHLSAEDRERFRKEAEKRFDGFTDPP